MNPKFCFIVLALTVLWLAACGGGSTATDGGTPANPGLPAPQFGHVFLVVEENADYSAVVGNPAMPYLNSLISQNALAANYFANTHPSTGNYFMLTTGQIISNDDHFQGTVTSDNGVRELVAAGKSWRSYAESLPSPGYTGDDVYPYLARHNPFAFFSDVTGNPAQAANLVPFSQFSTDLVNGSLPRYSFIVPNAEHDAHDCGGGKSDCTENGRLAAADNWLQSNIAPLIASSTFQNDGLLIVTFDEAASDNANGGGHIATIIISSKAKKGFQSPTPYQHQNTLRLSLEVLGVKTFPGAAAGANSMGEFFTQ